jgi:hypothetical protein
MFSLEPVALADVKKIAAVEEVVTGLAWPLVSC